MQNIPAQDQIHSAAIQQLQESANNVSISGSDASSKKMSVLQTIFGYERFKGKQEEAIDAILSGSDCLIILPTGAGKTLCYSIPTIIVGGLTVVISSLLSLMLDQVQHLRSKGLNVAYINSSVTDDDRNTIMHNMVSGNYNFVFVTPETAGTEEMRSAFQTTKTNGILKYIVIDECHCVDMWGFDFRPAYAQLGVLSQLKCPIVALTATCSTKTEGVIISSLQITNLIIVRETCNRKNISQFVKAKKGDGKDQVVNEILSEHKNKCGIIYCLQRSDTTDMAYLLQVKGINATYYHGELDPYKKKEYFQAWLDGKAQVMCATIAFGMGIDKADVRFVIHLSLPQLLKCYAQEFGRAGRDGEESTSCIFFRFEDRTRHMHMISSLPESEHRDLKRKKLNEVVKYCIIPKCRKLQLVHYFSEDYKDPCCNMCDVCLGTCNMEAQNASTEALGVLSCLNNVRIVQNKVTLNLLMLVYRGSKRKEVVSKSLHEVPEFGHGKSAFSESELKQFIYMLIAEDVILEELRGPNEIGSHPYLLCGSKAGMISRGELIINRYKYVK